MKETKVDTSKWKDISHGLEELILKISMLPKATNKGSK